MATPGRRTMMSLIAAAVVSVGTIGASAVGLLTGGNVADRAFASLQDQHTYRFTIAQNASVPGGPAAPSPLAGMAGAVDLDRDLARFTMNLQIGGVTAVCTTVASEEVVFLSVHPSRQQAIGAPWVRTDVAAVMGAAGFPGTFDTALGTGPGEFEDLERSGEETVRDVTTQRYSGRISLASLLSEEQVDSLGATFADDVRVDLFVDAEGLPRRYAATFDVLRPAKATFVTTTDFHDFGTRVDVELPRADDAVAGSDEEITTACLPANLNP